MVNLLRDECAFLVHAYADVGLFVPAEAAVVGLRADDEDGIRGIQLVEQPARLTAGRCAAESWL